MSGARVYHFPPDDLRPGEVWQRCTPARQLEIREARRRRREHAALEAVRINEASAATARANSIRAATDRLDAALARRGRLEAELARTRAQGIADTKAYVRGALRAWDISRVDADRLLTLAETDTLAATEGVIQARERQTAALATGLALEDVV